MQTVDSQGMLRRSECDGLFVTALMYLNVLYMGQPVLQVAHIQSAACQDAANVIGTPTCVQHNNAYLEALSAENP